MFKQNVELVGYHDLEGRPGFKLAIQEIGGNFFLYVASLWDSGWSILDVTDPTRPKLLRWVDGPANTWTIQVQVADGRMITALEQVPPFWTYSSSSAEPADGFLIWDISQPDSPIQLGHWRSGGRGTHRNFYNGGRYVHAAASMPGVDGLIYAAVDIDDPNNPVVTGTWAWPGQRTGEAYTDADLRRIHGGRPHPSADKPMHTLSLHGGAYALGNRAYCPWMRAGMVILDIQNQSEPRLVSTLSVYPPLGSSIAMHTVVPLPERGLAVVNSEALRERCDEPTGFAGIVDISDETEPLLISLFPTPTVPKEAEYSSFSTRGGRFGPHNQHQPQGLSCLQPSSRYVYLTYFNAGLQIYDIGDPKDPRIVGYFIPDDPEKRFGPMPRDLVTQAEDVIVDRRGYIYMTEKNSGVWVLGHTA